MTDMTLPPAATALIEATTGHLHYPVLDDEMESLGVSCGAVAACTMVIHERSGCAEPEPTYDDLDQMTTTCPKCEAIAISVLKVGAILNAPRTREQITAHCMKAQAHRDATPDAR